MPSKGYTSQTKAKTAPSRKQAGEKGHIKRVLRKKITRETQRVNARRRTELKENKINDAFHSVFEGMRDIAVLMLDKTGNVIDWNTGARNLLGYELKDILGKHFSRFFTKDDRRAHLPEKEFNLAKRTGRAEDENWIVRKDGSRFFANGLTTRLHDEQGKLKGFVKVIRDRTENKRLEEELHQRLEQQAGVAALGQHALSGLSLEALMQEATAMLTDILRTSHAKVLELLPDGKRFIFRAGVGWKKGVVEHATMRAGRHSQAGYALLFNTAVTFENLQKETRFGAEPLLVEHGIVSGMHVIISADGKPFGVLGTCNTETWHFTRDDTIFLQAVANVIGQAIERERALERLHALNENLEGTVEKRTEELQHSQAKDRGNLLRLKSVLAHFPFGVLLVDANDKIMEINEQFWHIWGIRLSSAEWVGKDASALRPFFKDHLLNYEEHIEASKKTTIEQRPLFGREVRMKDGRIILNDFIPLFEGGQSIGHLLLYRDVTQERRVDATKSEFMSLASHQLRTPLTTIRWSFGKLQRRLHSKTDDTDKKLLEEGRSAAARMSDTIDTMLQITRIESGQMELRQRDLVLSSLFDEVAAFYKEDYEHRRQTLTIAYPSIHVRTDVRFLKEVLENLLSNAIKYTPEQGTIRLSARKSDGEVLIEVQDTGYGIPKAQQGKIFHKFFRGENIVGKDTEGTGLGLYLVSLLTKLLKGNISFISEEGKGTTFTLRLPVRFP